MRRRLGLQSLPFARMEMDLYEASIYLGFAAALTPAAKERANRYLRWLFVIPQLAFDPFFQSPPYPPAKTFGDPRTQIGLRLCRQVFSCRRLPGRDRFI